MGRSGALQNKSKAFAIRIAKLYKYLTKDQGEHVMSKQLLRSGTSIGANVSECLYGQSDKDFVTKMYIALKEASETDYWLDVLYGAEFMEKNLYDSFKSELEEILKLLVSSIKKKKENMEVINGNTQQS